MTRSRGQLLPWPGAAATPQEFPAVPGAQFVATVHPSAILRADNQAVAYEGFRADLAIVARALARK